MKFADIWRQIKENIISKNRHNQPLLMWFDSTELLSVEPNSGGYVFRLAVPSALHQYWISQNLLETISSEISAIYSGPFHIDLVISKDARSMSTQPEPLEPLEFEKPVGNSMGGGAAPRDSLNPEYSFGTFVVGRNNEFAHAVSYSIANNPGGEKYNPLFICGPTGMGKTHLLHAVGNHVKEKYPHFRICYCTAERFLNEWVSGIRRKEMHNFRKKYREQCDILLMDDIQILGKGEGVQEEFFNTLNDFFERGQQVIVASDRMPKDIKSLEDRIRTRLEWGLIADIQMPDLETRMAILRYKAERKGLCLPQEVVMYIAKISKTSIRQLEGNLNKLKMFSELQGLPMTLDLSRKVLGSHDDTRNLTIDDVQKITADHFKVRTVDLKAKSRTQPLVTARQIAMYMIKKHLDKSLVEIGRAFGGKDHSTVINALRRIEGQLSDNADLKRDFNEIETKIHNITGV